jgi:pantoate--beta-alanine ligase
VTARGAFLALGSNAPDACARLEAALARLHGEGVRIAAVSRALEGPYEDADGSARADVAPVLNAVAEVRSEHEPRELMRRLAAIETALGRDRATREVRAVDLDLLDAGAVVDDGDLVLPHPRALDRAFVLAPWEEIAPRHVVTGTGHEVVEHAARLRARRPAAFEALRGAAHLALPDHGASPLVLEDAASLAAWRDARAGVVGLVPTMGALHRGHEALLRRARAECASVLATVFVNPAQFGPQEDLARYPRTLEEDVALLGRAGTDAVYVPAPADVYPEGFASWIVPEGPAEPLEGAMRPGHFRGVATVVYLLWRRARPDRAYFGRKDAQQLAVVRRMVEDLELSGTVVPCPTVREPDGLALSSRNRYLARADRERALGLSRALEAMAQAAASGTVDPEALRSEGARVLREAALDVDYLAVVDPHTMTPVGRLDAPALAVSTVRVRSVRLLDNRWLARAPREGGA